MTDDATMRVIEALKARYNVTVIAHAVAPRHAGRLENPDGYAKIGGSCEDTIEIFLEVKNNTIADASFTTDGCAASVAALDAALELISGKPVAAAASAAAREKILEFLGGLPESDAHRADLAAEAVRMAVLDCDRTAQNPWKKLYRKI
jgi:nitrogen fixation NifU-like protein